MKNKKLDMVAEFGVIVASINLGFFMQSSFKSSLGSLVVAIVMLTAGIWLKNKD